MKKRILIGITASYEHNPDVLDGHKTSVSTDYSNAILEAGGIPVILPNHSSEEIIDNLVNILDGIIFSGGVDPDPILYGEDCLQNLGTMQPERDKFEYLLLEKFEKTKKPILGICRGLQLINVFYGGTLYQDISYVNTKIQHKQKWQLYLPTHNINICDKNNILYEIFGEKTRVNSFHHQMIKEIAPNLTPIARSNDNIVEAFQMKNHPFFYAFQWHPEMMSVRGNERMKQIFTKFLETCETIRNKSD